MPDNNIIKRRGTASNWLKVLDGDDYVLLSNYNLDQTNVGGRVTTLEGQVQTAVTGLLDRMTALEARVTAAELATVPTGGMVLWGGGKTTPTIPPGFIVADGIAKSRTAYANLFAVYGTLYGIGDGSTTFGIPTGTNALSYGLAVNNNSRAVTFSTATESATHTHTINAPNANNNATNHTHDYSGMGNPNSNHTHGVPAVNSGNVSAWHSHNFTDYYSTGNNTSGGKTTSDPNANHYHYVPGVETGNVSAWHTHPGNTGNVSAWHGHGVNAPNSVANATTHTHAHAVISGTWLIKI